MSLSSRLRWYGKRLRVMGRAELAWRFREWWTVQLMRWPGAGPVPVGVSGFCQATGSQLPGLPWEQDSRREIPAELLAGWWSALSCHWRFDPGPNTWRRAPDTGRLWPERFFGSIAHRTGNPWGDVRLAWEPARLQQLVSLARLARGDIPDPGADPADGEAGSASRRAAIRLLEDELLSFVAANPPYTGIHYLSAMECALRLIAVCHALDIARGQLQRPAAVWAALPGLVASHARLIERRLSLHSSAGNHTIAEAAGLVYAGTLFPEFADAPRWRATGLELLTAEARRQILDDGGGLEQAFWYLLFITDLCGLVIALLEHRGESVPADLADRVARGRRFLGALAEGPADLPPVGDREDGHALSPALRLSFAGTPRTPGATTFPAAGYTLWRTDGPDVTEVLFDHGPLGMAPGYGHGHADALAITLRRKGRDLLVDPGTCTYTGPAEWRRHFRSTAAHNTVTVDGADQAVQEAAFLWSRPYRCELLRAESQDGVWRALARHDGYTRLPGKILHWRGLALRPDGQLTVWDRLDGEGRHTVELTWNVGVRVSPVGPLWLVGDDTMLEISGVMTTDCREGDTAPAAAGWRSRNYGTREPMASLRSHWRGQLPCEFVTRIFPRSDALPAGTPGSPGASAFLAEDLEVFRRWQ